MNLKDVHVVCLCDPDENVSREKAAHIEKTYGEYVATWRDLRDGLIDNVQMARGLVFRWRPDIEKKGQSQFLPYSITICGPFPQR